MGGGPNKHGTQQLAASANKKHPTIVRVWGNINRTAPLFHGIPLKPPMAGLPQPNPTQTHAPAHQKIFAHGRVPLAGIQHAILAGVQDVHNVVQRLKLDGVQLRARHCKSEGVEGGGYGSSYRGAMLVTSPATTAGRTPGRLGKQVPNHRQHVSSREFGAPFSASLLHPHSLIHGMHWNVHL